MIQPCAQCGKERDILARGLCNRCYRGLRRAGKLDRYPALGARGRPPTTRNPTRRYTDWRALADERKMQIDLLRNEVQRLMQHERALIDEMITLRDERDILMSELGEAHQTLTVADEQG
jgi:hypothetical protein